MLKLKFQDGRFMTVTYEPYKIKIIPLQKGKKKQTIKATTTTKKKEEKLHEM